MSNGDRRSLLGVLLFFGLLLLCFGFALALLRGDRPDEGRGPRIGVVEIEGIITHADPLIRQLRRFARDEGIKAIVLRVRSPGGSVGPAQELYREVERTRRRKPVVASLESVAASGGYYVASACNRVIANAGTLTGSLGVITQTTEVADLLGLAHIKTNTIKSGQLKDVGSPLRAMTERDRALLQSLVDTIQSQFLRDVARGRKVAVKDLEQVADGRVLTGEQALRLHLVDALGNLSDALDAAAALASAKGDPVLVYPDSDRGWLRELLGEGMESSVGRILGRFEGGARVEVRDPQLRP